jgi:uncharacterized protein (TIGR03435 family)
MRKNLWAGILVSAATLVLQALGNGGRSVAQDIASSAPSSLSALPLPAFRVDDFRASVVPGGPTTVSFNRGDLMAQNISLRLLLADAFGVGPDTIFGLDDATLDRRFDLRVVVELPEHMERKAEGAARRQVLQAVIADRLKLVAHEQEQELAVLALQVADGGIKFNAVPEHRDNSGITIANNHLTLSGDSMPHLAHDLDDQVRRIVVDQTGLKGNFDLNMIMPGNNGKAGVKQDWTALSAGMQQQVGLKLVESRAPVNTLVVDHVEVAAL